MARRLLTTSRLMVPVETPPITWSVKSCQDVPILAAGAWLLRSSMIEAFLGRVSAIAGVSATAPIAARMNARRLNFMA